MKKAFHNISDYESQKKRNNKISTFFTKLFGLLIRNTISNGIRILILKKMGVAVGKGVFIGKYCLVDDTYPELITIEDGVNISFGVTIVAHDASQGKLAKVIIKRGAYLGTRSIILPGVIIGEKAVIGAGAVVTSNVQPETKVAGVPARRIETSENY